MIDPQVSIVLAVHNDSNSLRKVMSSLLNQTLKEIEIIAINDASEDDCGALLDDFKQQDDRLNVKHLPKNVGLHEARRIGALQSRAPYIGFIDADDDIDLQMFSLLFLQCKKHDADIAMCGMYRVLPEIKQIKVKFKEQVVKDRVFEKFCNLSFGTGSLCNKLYKREIILPYMTKQFYWKQDPSEDVLVNIGCFLNAKKVFLSKEIMYYYIFNENSMTSNLDRPKFFVELFRAFAIAVDMYCDQGAYVIDNICKLYSSLLRAHLDNGVMELESYNQAMTEAFELIMHRYPLALFLFLNKKNDTLSFASSYLAHEDHRRRPWHKRLLRTMQSLERRVFQSWR
jgi:glycosyltransferase involved in cell wall biosynthesis